MRMLNLWNIVLRLCGILESDNTLVDTLNSFSTSFRRDVKQMLLKLVELRSSNWGRVHATSTYREATPENDPNYFMVCQHLHFKFCLLLGSNFRNFWIRYIKVFSKKKRKKISEFNASNSFHWLRVTWQPGGQVNRGRNMESLRKG